MPEPTTQPPDAEPSAAPKAVTTGHQPVEIEDEHGRTKKYGDAIDPDGNWKRFKELADDARVVLVCKPQLPPYLCGCRLVNRVDCLHLSTKR